MVSSICSTKAPADTGSASGAGSARASSSIRRRSRGRPLVRWNHCRALLRAAFPVSSTRVIGALPRRARCLGRGGPDGEDASGGPSPARARGGGNARFLVGGPGKDALSLRQDQHARSEERGGGKEGVR